MLLGHGLNDSLRAGSTDQELAVQGLQFLRRTNVDCAN